MKKTFVILTAILFIAASCQKNFEKPSLFTKPLDTVKVQTPLTTGFLDYLIPKGAQYCDKSTFTPVQYDELKFIVKFDSSAIYKTIDPANQADINKLFGFSDNNAQHHEFSARFGWCWNHKEGLCLYGYIYNNSVMSFKLLGAVSIGETHNCSIKVTPTNYIFTLDGKVETMDRASKTAKGSGYKLFPYFGGDEFAPHDIKISIKEL